MKYVMLIYETPPNLESRKDPGRDPYTAAWRAYYKALVAAGAYVGGAPLKERRDRNDGPTEGRQAPRSGRPICRSQGAARRLPHL